MTAAAAIRLCLVACALGACHSAAVTAHKPNRKPPQPSAVGEPAAAPVESESQTKFLFYAPGAAETEIRNAVPACAAAYVATEAGGACTFSAAVSGLPTTEQCEGGCARWQYRFRDGRVDSVYISLSVVDADRGLYELFAADADRIAAWFASVYREPAETAGDSWEAVENFVDGTELLLSERRWSLDSALLTWRHAGVPPWLLPTRRSGAGSERSDRVLFLRRVG